MKVLQLCVRPETRYFGLGHLFELGLQTAKAAGASVTQAFLEAHEQDTNSLHCGYLKEFHFSKELLRANAASIVKALRDFCIAERFDVIITHQYKAYRLLQLALKGQPQPLCLSVIHGMGVFSRLRRRIGVFSLRNKPNWQFVAISEAVKSDLEPHLWGVKTNRIHVLPNAIDHHYVESKQVSQAEARAFLGLSPGDFVFGALGRLVPKKGHLSLIRAFKQLTTQYPNVKCVIIGDGRLESDLHAEIQSLGLESKVKILGYVPQAFAYVKAFDIFMMPSLDEGFGIALLEAMAAKLPIIATEVGGIPEVMGTSHLIEAGHVDNLTQAMIEKMEWSEQERREEGQRHYKRLCEHFTSGVYQIRLLKLLSRVEKVYEA